MPSPAPQRIAASEPLPLTGHAAADSVAAWRRGKPVTASKFRADVAHTAAAMPSAGHVLNVCADRYWFAVAWCAALARGQVTLLPPTTTPHVIRAMREFAPDAYCACDAGSTALDLPRFELSASSRRGDSVPELPAIPAEQVAACVFTSGSTGEPTPHFKSWGSLVRGAQGEASRLQVGPGHAILGTVPAQHMYGLESTVLLPLVSGAALTAERLYYPADIDAAIASLAAPRVLFTTPFHLKMWLEGGGTRIETIVSATAPLTVGLARLAEERTGAALYEIYGCTEAGQVATRRPTQGAQWEALDGLRMWSEGGQALVAGGHVERPTPLQDVIEVGDDARRFVLHGRAADMVNIAGKRNSLAYLNHQLTSIPGVQDGVFFLPDAADADSVTRLTALVVAPALSAAQVLAALRERIDPAFLPRPLHLVDALPRQLTGKLPRQALRSLEREASRAAALRDDETA